jgi:DNA-binding NarL/FixJ family response regulator
MARLLLVDDHPLMRKGLALTLGAEPDLRVVAQADSAEHALELLSDDLDLVVTDVSLPGMSGLELTKHLAAVRPELPVIVVSRHDETLYAERALRAGARGYVQKLEDPDVIVAAVRRVLRGGIHVSPAISDRLLMGIAGGTNRAKETPAAILSDRELEVFEMTGRGVATREIAERLHLSVKTVESYRARIKEKLGLTTAAELMQHAVQWVAGEGREH